MFFFETTPAGRILNRFTSDTEAMDAQLTQNLAQWLNCIMPNALAAPALVCFLTTVYEF